MKSPSTAPSQRVALAGLVRKELRQIRADRRLLPILVVAPVLQLFVFGYAATLDVATLRLVVLDRDHSSESRALASRFVASETFEMGAAVTRDAELEAVLDRGEGDLALVIPSGYGRALNAGGTGEVQLVIDGSNSVPASIGLAAAVGAVQRTARDVAEVRLRALGSEAPGSVASLRMETRVFYNPDLRSRFFMVPGVLGLLLMLVTTIATSMATVREKESGTLEQLIVTPVARSTLLAGKLIPFVVISFVDALVVLSVAHWWFGVPLEGSALLLVGNVLPFLLSTLGLGLLVSTVSRTQQQAMMTAMFFVMMPMMYLSGFIFPIESMPYAVQLVTEVIPLTHFLAIVRGVMLKGAGVAELLPAIIKLTVIGAAVFSLAVVMFRKRLD